MAYSYGAMFRGAFTALVTPFRDGAVDVDALRRLVSEQIDAGIDGLVPCGTTGESPALTSEEHAAIVRAVVEETRGRVPVVVGAGTASTRHTVDLVRSAKKAGAQGVLLVAPYYVKPTQEGLFEHFKYVLGEAPLPAMLYNIPGRTGIDIQADTIARLAKEVPEVVAVKEATGNVLRTQEILARTDRLAVLSGDDALTVAILAVGGTGVVSVTSNLVPGRVAAICRAWQEGDVAQARKLHYALLALHEAMFLEGNPGPVKAALAARGKIAAEIRLPLVLPRPATLDALRGVLSAQGLLP